MKEHVIDLLSSFVDGQLPDAERRMVEAHLSKCEACGQELKDLKGLTALLAGVQRSPLPTGFHQRLERRRRAEEAAAAERPPSFLPMPARIVAYAVPAVLVCIVGYDALRGPGRLEDRLREVAPMAALEEARFVDGRATRALPGPAANLRSASGGGAADSLEAPANDAADGAPVAAPAAGLAGRSSRFELPALAGAIGAAGLAGRSPAVPALAGAIGAAGRKKEARAPGAPLGVADVPSTPAATPERTLSNAELQNHLERERRKMGIEAIVPPGQAARREDSDQPPMSAAEAREYMRAMAEGLARQRMNMDNFHEPVPLGKGSQPKLLKPQEPAGSAGAPIGAEDQKAARAGAVGGRGAIAPRHAGKEESPAGVRGMDSGSLQAAAGIAQAPVISLPFSGVEKDEAEKSERKAAPVNASKAKSRASLMAFGSAGGAAAAPMARSLAEPAATLPKADRPAGPSVETARSAEELKRLWERLGTAGTPPAVDFETEMVVAVSAPSPVEIVKVWASGRRMVVEYRPLPDGEGPGSAFRVAPRSDLPPSLQLVK